MNERRFRLLCEAGEIRQEGCQFLDGLKIALHAAHRLLRLPPAVDASARDAMPLDHIELPESDLEAGRFYLAQSVERVALSDRVFGMMHTRSEWARVGLDCLGSSSYVSPGFGQGVPLPIVLELRPAVTIKHLELDVPLASLILFELDEPVRTAADTPHAMRFPIARF